MPISPRSKTAAVQGAALMAQAPAVVMMRLPILFLEFAGWTPGRRQVESERAVAEKMAAGFETIGKVHAEVMGVWGKAWIDALSGTFVTQAGMAAHVETVTNTSLEPYARRVNRNVKRLTRSAR